MATREENLKKINAELEKLSDEELEKVAGGVPVSILDAPANLNIESNANLQGGLEEHKKYGRFLSI